MNNTNIARLWPFGGFPTAVSSRSIGWIALFVCILSAATYNPFAKILTGSLTPVTLFFLSELLTGFFVVFSFGFMPVVRDLAGLPRKRYLPMVLIGLMSGTTAPLLLFSGLRWSTAVNASLFINTEMIFMVILAVTVLGEKFRREHLLSILTISAGILTISLRGFTEGITFYPGDILLILSGMAFGAGSIMFRKMLHHRVQPHLVMFVRSSTAVTVFFLMSPFIEHPLIADVMAFPLRVLPVLIGFAFISRFLTVFSFYEALDRLPVTTVSLMNNLTVIVSIFFSWMILGETIQGYHLMGGALIILGTLIIEFAGMHPTPKHHEIHLRHRHGHR